MRDTPLPYLVEPDMLYTKEGLVPTHIKNQMMPGEQKRVSCTL